MNYLIEKSISRLLKEYYSLNEARQSPSIGSILTNFFSGVDVYLNNELISDESIKSELISECNSELKLRISQIAESTFEYNNFYVIKFSDFLLKIKDKQKIPITFLSPTDTSIFKDKITSFYLYIYQDTIFKILPYSENLKSDSKIEEEVKKFVISSEFDDIFSTKTQRTKFNGEIIIRTVDSPITVVSSILSGYETQDSEEFRKKNKNLKVNGTYYHVKYGTGIILSIEKSGRDGDQTSFIVTVKFPHDGIKKLYLKFKPSEKIKVKRGKGRPVGGQLDIPKEKIEELLKTYTIYEIADILGVSWLTLKRRCLEYGIDCFKHKSKGRPKKEIITKEELEELSKTLTLSQIAKFKGVSYPTIEQRCKEYGIDCLGRGSRPKKETITKEELGELMQTHTIPQIAELKGVDVKEIINKLKNLF